MATAEALLRIKVIADASSAAAGLDKAQGSASKFGSAMRRAALPAAAVVAGIGALGAAAVKSASDLQQAEGAVEAVFGRQAAAVKRAAQSAAVTMGLSAAQYENYAALVGGALQNAGFSVEDSVGKSGDIMQRGADLAATYGGTTAEAVEAINAAISRSEFDPLEKFNVSLNMTAVNAKLAAKGQADLTGKALAHAKAQVILEEIYGKSAKAAGQYAREADTVAGRQQTMTAEIENAKASLGTALLPVVSKAVALLGKFATFAQKNTTTVQILAGVLGGLAVAVLAINAAMSVWNALSAVSNGLQLVATRYALGTRIQLAALRVQEIATAAASKVMAAGQWLLNAALSANPIGLVVIALIALVAAFVLAYKKSATFRRIVDAAFRAVVAGAKVVGKVVAAVFSAAWRAASLAVKSYLSVIRAVLSTVRAIVSTVASWIRGKFGDVWRVVSQVARTQIAVIRQAVDSIRAVISAVASALRTAWSAAWRAARDVAVTAAEAVKRPIDAAKSAVENLIGAVRNLISWIGRIHFPSPPSFLKKIPGVGSLAAPVPTGRGAGYTAAPTVRGLGAGRAASSSGGVTIVVNGALDPESVARQIGRIVNGHERRVGLRTA